MDMDTKKFIEKKKLSKKARRALDQAERNTWAINPMTRKPANPRAYSRVKTRIDEDTLYDS